MLAKYEARINAINEIEERIIDNDQYPVIENNKIKICCYYALEITKAFINYLKTNIKNCKKNNY